MESLDSIFDTLKERANIGERLKTINYLFKKAKCITTDWFSSYGSNYDMSIEDFANGPSYLTWPHRNGTANPGHLKSILGIDDFSTIENDRVKTCHYLEFVYNITAFVYGQINNTSIEFNENVFVSVFKDVEDAAGMLGMRFLSDEGDRYILCANDAPIVEASIVADQDEMFTLVRYLHFASNGDLERKGDCLAKLYKHYEARIPKLDGPEFKNLCDEIGLLTNSLNTRHNNLEGKNANPVLEAMSDNELERWYDYLAGLFAEAILAERRVEMRLESKSLRCKLRH